MWIDTEIPLAFLIAFRCHGTWLHGDERGSLDRSNNVFGTPVISSHPRWHSASDANLACPPVFLSAAMRDSVETAIKETCHFRDRILYAINIRTNHGHVVVDAGSESPSKVLQALKANATRYMRQRGVWREDFSPWSVRGSKRFLWKDKSVNAAIDYVLYGPGDELPNFA